MNGISSNAYSCIENRYKFNNGSELNDDFDINLYETIYRGYDPQIGRFEQIDGLASEFEEFSPYAFANNNPVLLNDPLGLMSDSSNPVNMSEVKVTSILKKVDNIAFLIGILGLQTDIYEELFWKGEYIYKTSGGKIQSVFDTKWGSNKTPEELGNLKNYSKNARRSIKFTKGFKSFAKTLLVAGIVIDVSKAIYAIATDDPNKVAIIVKSSANVSIAIYGAVVPGVGWVVSGIFFLGEALIPGGWGAALEAGYQNTLRNREIIPNWNPRPGGGLGN